MQLLHDSLFLSCTRCSRPPRIVTWCLQQKPAGDDAPTDIIIAHSCLQGFRAQWHTGSCFSKDTEFSTAITWSFPGCPLPTRAGRHAETMSVTLMAGGLGHWTMAGTGHWGSGLVQPEEDHPGRHPGTWHRISQGQSAHQRGAGRRGTASGAGASSHSFPTWETALLSQASHSGIHLVRDL